MTLIEILLIILIVLIVAFLLFWFYQGSSGRVSLRRPVESRVDEYLDRRFAQLVEEWGVVRRPKLKRFKEERGSTLDADEMKIAEVKKFENEFIENLSELEARLDALEKSLESKK
ncbi:hypothetical protein KHC33_05260 [Methanospirillum sp. J.3.6.1-F.2.7.3]|jgi:hypothetical protein|uniref:Uncharacterized protein n=2 Tax=Methanospirillum TaxID=2202 RepID=A0A8E7EK85_9EURY|nr:MULTISPECIES: hypothetical protein [Methanospirillum]MDX8551452.1 hypothetical protein [Methanospirillum hungatei]NLW75369.1 hypothetical protein [Methanomicrobiales archaeon]QVV89909.1 hypothetical protein KHC33_05260 [Methanospirillum sp. J.3.6.1-F.2.7.3]QXO94315.1 hypothetical protein KSK55_13415 [Methanospirillum hungatei]